MRKMKVRCFCVMATVLLTVFAKAQSYNMQEVDRFIQSQSITVNSSKDLELLAGNITSHYADSLSRAEAAYLWVAKNITYNESGNGLQHYASNVDSVLKYKTTICAGYVNVFCLLCQKIGITAKEVDGFGKTGTQFYHLNTPFASNHSWAAVWLNGRWNLTDVTWGSGYTLEGTQTFVRQTNGWYFFTAPETFILDHYPKNPQWQLLKDTVSWAVFLNYPNIGLGAKENEISSCEPAQSVIHTNAGKAIAFSFTSKKLLNSILIMSRQKGFQEVGTLIKCNDNYYYNYRVPADGQYDLQIDLSDIDRTKPGTYNSLIDFTYFIDAAAKNEANK